MARDVRPSFIQSEGEAWAKFLDLIGRHDKGPMVVAELFRCPVGESGVGPDTIVIIAPSRQQRPRFGERGGSSARWDAREAPSGALTPNARLRPLRFLTTKPSSR